MQNNDKFFGIRLKKERIRLSYTLINTADLIDVTARTFSRWEAGKPMPSNKLLELEPLGFDVYYVLTGGRLSSELENAGTIGKIKEETSGYSNSEQEKTTRNPVPSSEQQLGTLTANEMPKLDDVVAYTATPKEKQPKPIPIGQVAKLGNEFFTAWDHLFYTHGTEIQTAIMTALKGPYIAHVMVSSQFKNSDAVDECHELDALNESKKS